MEVAITVVDDRQQPLPAARLRLRELATGAGQEEKTDAQGLAHFHIDVPGTYEVWVNDSPASSDPVLVRANQKGSTSLFLTYNPVLQQRTRRQSFERNGLRTIDMGPVPATPADGYNRLEVSVVNSAGLPQASRQVCVVCLDRHTLYCARTDASGMASFHLPAKQAYDIDVEEQRNASFVVQENLEGYTLAQTVVYDEYPLQETRRNDTVQQQVAQPVEGRHSRALYRIRVRRAGKPWAGGSVFLDEVGGRTVYRARTDAQGEAVFLLPFGAKYLVQFPYERDVEVINLRDARDVATGSLELTYRPNPAQEHPERFVPTPAQLLLTNYPYYHRNPYPVPATPGGALLLRSGGTGPDNVLEVGVSARGATGRPPLNLSFVLDISGSMAGHERIESLQRGLASLIGQLRSDDVIAITLFNDNTRLLFPAQPLGNKRQALLELVAAIEPSGGTNMRGALETGYREAMRHYRPGAGNTLVILSDGYDSNSIDTLLAAQAPWKDKVLCTAIGVGNDYNYDLLRRLVTPGTELLQQAHEGAELEKLFTEKLVPLSQPALRQVELEVRATPALAVQQSFGLLQPKTVAGVLRAALPDLYPGQELPCLIRFAPCSTAVEATVILRYTDVATGRREERSGQATLLPGGPPPAAADEHRKLYTVAFVNDCLLRMALSAERLQWNDCRKALESATSRLQALYPGAGDADIDALRAKVALYATALKHVAYQQKIGD